MRLILALLLLPLLWPGTLLATDGQLQPVPALRSPVTDLTGLLSAQEQQTLASRILAFEQEKGSQIAVLVVPTTQPEDIFSYSLRVAEQWKLGRKGVDDGVLFVIALQDRKTHIQVGYGLEGAIPDITAKRILQDIVAPHFRAGDFNAGIDAGVDALIKAASGEALPAPTARQDSGQDIGSAFVIGMLAAFFTQLVLGRVLGGLIGGGVGFGAALLMGAGLGLSAVMGLGVALAVWIFLGGGFIPGGGGGFGGRGGGFGGGGFRGGGGSFGGGGASGSW